MGTDFLYARPSLLSGMASAMDLGGILVSEYNRSRTPNLADLLALKSDWAIVGMDMDGTLRQFDEEYATE